MRRLGGLLIVSICFLPLGCGEAAPDLGTPVTVTGTVTLNDKPVGKVTVSFMNLGAEVPPEYRSFNATTDAQGSYTIEEIYPGKYSVSFGEAGSDPDGEADEDGEPDPDAMAEFSGPLKGYMGETEETADVADGKTKFDFALTTGSSPEE